MLLVLALVLTTATERKEVGNLVIEGIPEIPKRIEERSLQYANIRGAGFVDWHPGGRGMLISTRFGDTSQLHHVAAPGSDREQLTFFNEPVSAGAFDPGRPDRGFIYGTD